MPGLPDQVRQGRQRGLRSEGIARVSVPHFLAWPIIQVVGLGEQVRGHHSEALGEVSIVAILGQADQTPAWRRKSTPKTIFEILP